MKVWICLTLITISSTSCAYADRALTLMDVMPTASDRVNMYQQGQQMQQNQRMYEQQMEAARLRNEQLREQAEQGREEARKRQHLLDLQIEEAEAKAAERVGKGDPPEKQVLPKDLWVKDGVQMQADQEGEEALKRQHLLDLQIEEAEAKAAERRGKTAPSGKEVHPQTLWVKDGVSTTEHPLGR